MIFVRGGRLGLPGSSRVALAWHTAMGNTPFRGNFSSAARRQDGARVSVSRQLAGCQREAWGVAPAAVGCAMGARPWRWAGAAALGTSAGRRRARAVSQRSLHNAPIFRLLLKVAVNGTHQCDFPNFCGQQCPTSCTPCPSANACLWLPA